MSAWKPKAQVVYAPRNVYNYFVWSKVELFWAHFQETKVKLFGFIVAKNQLNTQRCQNSPKKCLKTNRPSALTSQEGVQFFSDNYCGHSNYKQQREKKIASSGWYFWSRCHQWFIHDSYSTSHGIEWNSFSGVSVPKKLYIFNWKGN